MKRMSKLWPALVTCGLLAAPVASASLSEGVDERDFKAVVDYINSKRTIDLPEKSGNLRLSGDIRSGWQYRTNKTDPTNSGTRTTVDGFNHHKSSVNTNLMLDYKCDRSWGVAQLEFENNAGTSYHGTINDGSSTRSVLDSDDICQGSGSCNAICLKKAYMGYNICSDGYSRWDLEVGRRRFYNVFDSRIQFQSFFDGLLLNYASQLDCTDVYGKLAGFVVDYNSPHYGWVFELGALNIQDSGFDAKYSYIDWASDRRLRDDTTSGSGWAFRNSQLSVNYHFVPEVLCVPAKLYGAFLVNHASTKNVRTANKHECYGWYLGFLVGEVVRAGDWSVDVNYQNVQAQAVADCEVSGISRGNTGNRFFNVGPATALDSIGNANYSGFRFDSLYAVTDNLNLEAVYEFSTPEIEEHTSELQSPA